MKTLKHTSVVAALVAAGAVSFVGSAAAVGVNADGLGEALIYPYYTGRGGNNTLLSVVNTTNNAKAVKVRFREAKNSEDVLDFNLFLSPWDVWTGAVTKNGAGARLITNDRSCTAPAKSAWVDLGGGAYAVDFFNYAYNATDGGAAQTLDRTLEGYVEIIEMATIVSGTSVGGPIFTAAKHVNGVAPCGANIPTGAATITGVGIEAPSGGLFGAGTYINVGAGATTSVNATALNGFGRTGAITPSDNVNPNFADHNSNIAAVTTPTQVIVANMTASSAALTAARATSAALTASNVYGEYAYSADLSLASDWVITFPTKNFFVNGSVPIAPFSNVWNRTAKIACEPVSLISTDREEGRASGPGVGFSPRPPDADPNSLCYEANVITFGPGSSTATTVLSSANGLVLNGASALQVAGKDGGWLDLSFTGTNAVNGVVGTLVAGLNLTNGSTIGGTTVTFVGLPVVGFAASGVKVTNPPAGSPRDNYSASTNLSFKRTINFGN
jgi:hypothetical protein